MWTKTFCERYCERFGCPAEDFEKRLFWKCLYRRSLPLSVLVHRLRPAHFEPDRQAIRQLGLCRSSQEFRVELESFRYDYQTHGGMLRQLRVRISGKRLTALLREVGQERAHSAGRRALVKETS